MKKTRFLIPLFLMLCMGIKAQEDAGLTIRDLLLQKSYPGDSIAEAALINDIGRSYFLPEENHIKLHFERKMIYKIYNKAGLRWGEIRIPFYYSKENEEKVYDITGETYSLENGIAKATPIAVGERYEETINQYWKVLKLAVPNLKEGSVFAISYKISSPFHFNLRSWDFQYSIPVQYSKYTTLMNPFYEYIFILQNTNKLNGFNSYVVDDEEQHFSTVTYRDKAYEFLMTDIPAFRDETYISSADDYKYKLNFQLAKVNRLDRTTINIMSTWDKISYDLLSSDYGYTSLMSKSRKTATKIVDTMLIKTQDPKEKIRKIERYVKDNFTWDKIITDNVNKDNANNFLTTHHGSSAEINLFLIGMLRAAKIEANPLLISTRGHGKVYPQYPFLHFFDNLIAQVKLGEEELLLDATDPLSNFGEIPIYCYNDSGLVLNKKQPNWIKPTDKHLSNTSYTLDLTPNPLTYKVAGKVTIEANGYDALLLRNLHNSDIKKFDRTVMPSSFKLKDSIRTQKLTQPEANLEVGYDAEISMGYIGNKLIIVPFSYLSFVENPLKQPTRRYPIDMIYRNGKNFKSTIHIPAGYTLLTKPDSLSVSDGVGKINYSAEMIDPQTLVVKGNYEFSKDIYTAGEYAGVKAFFDKIVTLFNGQVTFVKVAEINDSRSQSLVNRSKRAGAKAEMKDSRSQSLTNRNKRGSARVVVIGGSTISMSQIDSIFARGDVKAVKIKGGPKKSK